MRIFKPRFKGRDGTYREATNYAMEFEAGGKRTVKSLQTPNRATAEARAKLLMAQTRDRGWEILKPRLPGARLMKIEDLCALYRLYATTKERPLSPFTIGKNICTFRRLAREMETDSVEAMVGKVKEWRAAAMTTKSPISIATDLRSAACVFTEEAKRYYVESGWAMVDPFDGVKVPQFEIKPFEGYPIHEVQRLIGQAKEALKPVDQPAYAVFIMGLCAGMRAQEAAWAQWSHLRPNGIVVDNDPTMHTTKSRRTRFVPLPPSVIRELCGLDRKEPFIMADAERPNGRKKVGRKRGYRVLKRLSAWLRTQGIMANHPIHYLRKIFGSVVATRHGLFAAREYLGHSSVVVTEKHYAALLEKPVVDLMAEVTAA